MHRWRTWYEHDVRLYGTGSDRPADGGGAGGGESLGGEGGGFLHVVLQQIADFRTREQELKGKIKAAMVYPAVLACLACAVLVFLLTFFIPRFSGIFAEFGSKLPLLTRVIVVASGWLLKYGWAFALALIIGIVSARRALTSEAGRRFLER